MVKHNPKGFIEAPGYSGVGPQKHWPVAATVLTHKDGSVMYVDVVEDAKIRQALHDGKNAVDVEGLVLGPIDWSKKIGPERGAAMAKEIIQENDELFRRLA
jgi:hypothetical protein